MAKSRLPGMDPFAPVGKQRTGSDPINPKDAVEGGKSAALSSQANRGPDSGNPKGVGSSDSGARPFGSLKG